MSEIMIIDDDVYINNMLKETLSGEGYDVYSAYSGTEAELMLKTKNPDLILLDLMLPGITGEELITRIKNIPVIVISAKADTNDKVKLLLNGAEDYVTKPFDMEELLARVNATIRRSFDDGKPDKNLFHIGTILFDYAHQTLTCGDNVQRLTMKESELLRMFAMNFNQLVDRTSTLQKIWKDDSYFAARSMDVYITKLRKYLKVDPQVQIVNVHGVGFKLTVKNE